MPRIDRRALITGLVLMSAGFIFIMLTLPGLYGPLVLDSLKLQALEAIIAEHGLHAVWYTPGLGEGIDRVVSMASFLLNIQLAGELSAPSLRSVNIVLHLINGILVFILTRMLVRMTRQADNADVLALATAVLWLLSPVNFNVTMYVIQRMAQLAALFTLSGLIFYISGRLQSGVWRRWICLILSLLVCLPLAVLSKQNGILLVGFVLLVEWWFLQPLRPWLSGRSWLGLILAGLCIGIVGFVVFYPEALNYQQRDFSLIQRLLSQPRALLSYLQQLVLPLGNDTAVYSDDFIASQSLLKPLSTLFAMAICIVAVAVAVVARRSRFQLAAFGILFYFVGHGVESTIIPLELYFLHRNYLPSLGIYLALCSLLLIVVPRRQWLVIVLAIYALYFAAVSYTRSHTWSNRGAIITAAVQHHPGSARAWSDVTQLSLEQGRVSQALAANRHAIAINDTFNLHLQKLYILCAADRTINEQAFSDLREVQAFGVSNEMAQALDNLLRLYETGACPQLPVDQLVALLDSLSARYAGTGGDPWTIEYYAHAFLYQAGQVDRVHKRLQHSLAGGRLRAGLYRLDLLIASGAQEQARQTLAQINRQFSDEQLSRYAGLLERYQKRLHSTK